jgi:hypothetical protein
MMLLLDAIACVILTGMMLVPIVNLIAGAILGAALGGAPGGVVGFLLAIIVAVAEKVVADRLGWFELQGDCDDAVVGDIQQMPVLSQGMQRHLLRRRVFGSPKVRRRPARLPTSVNCGQSLH